MSMGEQAIKLKCARFWMGRTHTPQSYGTAELLWMLAVKLSASLTEPLLELLVTKLYVRRSDTLALVNDPVLPGEHVHPPELLRDSSISKDTRT